MSTIDDPEITGTVVEDQNGDRTADLIANLRRTRDEVANVFGSTKVIDVPGYNGLLSVEYQYINSEVTEQIAKDIRRETKNVNGKGTTLLGSLDTLAAASKNVLIRDEARGDWVNEDGSYGPGVRGIDGDKPVTFRTGRLAQILGYSADEPREVILGLFGSEHKIIEQNVILSRWLTDKSRTMDEDFLG